MDCVGSHITNGLLFNSTTKALSIKLDVNPSNIATVSPAGLLVAGTVTPGSGSASVAKMLTLPIPVVGSSYGAGSSVWPEGMTYTYEQAAELVPESVSLVHVPIRRTSELMPVALANDVMSLYNPSVTDAILGMDTAQLDQVEMQPSGPADEPNTTGWFGFATRRQRSVPLLSNVFTLLGNKTVLYLEVKDTSAPIDTADRIKNMVPGWDLSKSVIVAGEPVAASGAHATILHAVLASFAGSGIPVGAHMTTGQQVLAYNGTTLAGLGVQWVSLPYWVVDDQGDQYIPGVVQDYHDHGLKVLINTVTRQWHWNRAVALAVRGVLCFDPIYASGARSSYRYRRDSKNYTRPAPSYGLHGPYSNVSWGQKDFYRSYVRPGNPEQLVYHQLLQNPGINGGFDPSGYWVLHGRMAPFRSADTYFMQCWVYWDQLLNDKTRWAGLWFDRPSDRSLKDWTASDQHSVGYDFILDQTGNMVCTQYTGTPASGGGPPPDRFDFYAGASGYGALQARVAYGIRIEVEPTVIRGYRIGTNPGVVSKTQVFTFNNTHARWARYITGANKGYPFFGRHFFEDDPGWSTEVRIIQPSVGYTF
jgi:hypothetical protein